MNTEHLHLLTPTRKPGAPAILAEVADHPFLSGLSRQQLEVLADCAMKAHFDTGERIFREGDPANRFYLIEKGRVSLEASRLDEPPVSIQTIGPGDVLGWSWLFEPYRAQFDARAIEPTTAIFLYGTRLRDRCEADHDLGYEVMKRIAAVVIQRLQATRRQLLAK